MRKGLKEYLDSESEMPKMGPSPLGVGGPMNNEQLTHGRDETNETKEPGHLGSTATICADMNTC